MRRRSAVTALALGALLVASGADGEGAGPTVSVESVPPPGGGTLDRAVPPEPATVTTVAAPATKGWSRVVRRRPEALEGPMMSAYTAAVAAAPAQCHLRLSLLEAIGQVESGNAAGRVVDEHHRVVPEIVGPALDGSRYAALPDTDRGTLDHDRVWDHAVGPFQFIPSSWRVVAVDLDGDGRRDPQDVFDAAGAAMVYLCAGGRDLQDPAQLEAAVLAYNHSTAYLRSVLRWQTVFETGGDSVPTPTLTAVAVLTPATPQPAGAAHHGRGSGVLDPVALHAEPPPPGAATRPPDAPAPTAVATSARPAPVETDDPPAPSCTPSTEVPSDTPTDPPTEVPTGPPTGPPTASPAGSPGDLPTEAPGNTPAGPSTDAPSALPTGAAGDVSTDPTGSPDCGAPPVVAGAPTDPPTGTEPVNGG